MSNSDVFRSVRGARIYKWLRRKPPIIKVVATDDDDEEFTVSLDRAGTPGNPKWKDAIHALYRATHMRGLNEAGEVVRVLELDPERDSVLASADRVESEYSHARRDAREGREGGSGRAEIISIDVPRLVDNIARNMKEVAAASAEQQAQAFSKGFEAMTNVINLCLGMLQRVDNRLEQLELAQPPEEPEEAPEPERNELVENALRQALGGGGVVAPDGSVNPQQAAALAGLLQQYLGGGAKQRTQPEPNGHAGQ